MKLRFLGKDSTPTNSPTLYATDQDSCVVQGWIVTDRSTLGRLDVGEGETLVEVPAALLEYLTVDGLHGQVINMVPPIVAVTPSGHYILQGRQVTDVEPDEHPRARDLRAGAEVSHAHPGWRVERLWSRSRRKSGTSS